MKLPRNLTLTPGHRYRIPNGKTLGYFGGLFPSILVHLDDQSFEVQLGQCIPTAGAVVVEIENHFARTGQAQIVQDAPVSVVPMESAAALSAQRYSTFFAHVHNDVAAPDFMGIGMLLNKGVARVTMKGVSMTWRKYPKASEDYLDYKPDGMNNTANLEHETGGILADLKCVYGGFDNPFDFNWMTAAGYNPDDRFFVDQGNELTFWLERGAAIFGSTSTLANSGQTITVEYFGEAGLVGA